MQTELGTVLDIELTDSAHGGFCVGRVPDGRVVFVRGGIPGEHVLARVYEQKKRFMKAVVEQVLEASAHRVQHRWSEGGAGITGAADFGHIDLAWQRELKGFVIRTQIERVGGQALTEQLADVDVTPRGIEERGGDGDAYAGAAEASESCAHVGHRSDFGVGWHTRTRFDVIALDEGVGMYREHSHELIRLDSMPLAVPEISDCEIFTHQWAKQSKGGVGISPGMRLHVVASSTGECFIAAGKEGRVYCLSDTSDSSVMSDVSGVAAGSYARRVLGDGGEEVYERVQYGHDVYEYRLSPTGFWQVHYAAPRALLETVMADAQVQEGERVLELFSGAGLFSVPLARAIGERGRMLSIEGSQRAVDDAVFNLASYSWVQARQGWIDAQGVRAALRELKPALVVADPPRAGLGIGVTQEIATAQSVQRVVLVSCDPAAMARDAGAFVQAGWHVTNIHAFDLFPQTHHVETVVCLCRKS